MLDNYILTKGDKAYINIELHWLISLLINKKSLLGFAKAKLLVMYW